MTFAGDILISRGDGGDTSSHYLRLGLICIQRASVASYDSLPQPEPDGLTDRPVLVISIGAIVLYSSLPELLAHYTNLSWIARIGVTGAAVLLVQFVAFRVLNQVRRKA